MKKFFFLSGTLGMLLIASQACAQQITAQFDGTLKAKWELSEGDQRFNLRNSRVGVRGAIGSYVDYRIQVELSNEGTFSPLDLFGTIKPAKGLNINFGQSSVLFDNSYVVTPGELMFANRAFLGKYFNPSSRSIGAIAQYRFALGSVPMEVAAGIWNGEKINDPVWMNIPSWSARIVAGRMDGFRTSVKSYRYHSLTQDLLLLGADVHYADRIWRVEAEVQNKHSYLDGSDLQGAYIQGAHTSYFRREGMFNCFTPAVRWDAMGYDALSRGLDVNRLTLGINLGLSKMPFGSVLRVDYEWYFIRKGIDASQRYFVNSDLHAADNKLSVELLLKF